MNSIIMNIDDSVDIDVIYSQLKKQYPKFEIIKRGYAAELEEAEDEYLLALAEERLKNNRPLISHEEMWKRLGVTEDDLENVEAAR